jgi:hypothetical protein
MAEIPFAHWRLSVFCQCGPDREAVFPEEPEDSEVIVPVTMYKSSAVFASGKADTCEEEKDQPGGAKIGGL